MYITIIGDEDKSRHQDKNIKNIKNIEACHNLQKHILIIQVVNIKQGRIAFNLSEHIKEYHEINEASCFQTAGALLDPQQGRALLYYDAG